MPRYNCDICRWQEESETPETCMVRQIDGVIDLTDPCYSFEQKELSLDERLGKTKKKKEAEDG